MMIEATDTIGTIKDEEFDWRESLDYIYKEYGENGVNYLLNALREHAEYLNVDLQGLKFTTPYINTIPVSRQPVYPGDIKMEKRIENIIRWNAKAMVMRGVDRGWGIGGHIATYASAATMLEVGFNHVFRGAGNNRDADIVMPQPHAAPGIYARAFLEGRLTRENLDNFRRELGDGGGLCSYPHPRSMPNFWELPNASMGLSVPSAIYQARFAKYLQSRGLKTTENGKIWCFIGDGESDEPEVLGSISIAAREQLENLVLVVNCNLQRLDGPVRGNGKIIQELEKSFRGADWNVIKVIWGSGWDELLDRDHNGALRQRMEECLDGDYQMYSVKPGCYQREHWVGASPELRALMGSLTDEEIKEIKRGGQDPKKVYAAFAQASRETQKPTVILVKTIKGDGMGEGSQGRNAVHQRKNISEDERVRLAKELDIPITEEQAKAADLYLPDVDSPERRYLNERRQELGGYLPSRKVETQSFDLPSIDIFSSLIQGSGNRTLSSTTAMIRLLQLLLRDKQIGKYIVPIVPDEARTFGMDSLFANAAIWSVHGQKYQPVDADTMLAYRERKDGQILQEGICETGAIASFMAAGTAYAVHGVPTVPFYIFYSMFGFQRVGDMIWACGDMMARGFLLGGTAGRTTLNGEGLQHQDGHSHVLASTVPNLMSYDPAFGYELAVIVHDGMRRMYVEGEKIFYYITLYNENYSMPAMPSEDVSEGILKGAYCFSRTEKNKDGIQVNLLASGAIMQQVLTAASKLEGMGYNPVIWSVTSFTELEREALDCERERRLNPSTEQDAPYVSQLFKDEQGVFVAVTDYMKKHANAIARWMPSAYDVLGTDGFGLSETRDTLRDYFEISTDHIIQATLALCFQDGLISREKFDRDTQDLHIDNNKNNSRFH